MIWLEGYEHLSSMCEVLDLILGPENNYLV